MACHTWFFKDAKIALNEDCTDEEFDDNHCDDFQDYCFLILSKT